MLTNHFQFGFFVGIFKNVGIVRKLSGLFPSARLMSAHWLYLVISTRSLVVLMCARALKCCSGPPVGVVGRRGRPWRPRVGCVGRLRLPRIASVASAWCVHVPGSGAASGWSVRAIWLGSPGQVWRSSYQGWASL